MEVVVGLGNPGPRYASTRHNLGFRVVDLLLQRFGASMQPTRGPYELAEVRLAGRRLLLVKPTTYVNRTGAAVVHLVDTYGFVPEQLLAVVDDVHLGFGRLRLRPSGGAGGHNGLQSFEEQLQSQDYARLRLGVGAPRLGESLSEHVLGEFTAAEREGLPELLETAADAVESIRAEGFEATRARINASPQDSA